MGKRFLLILLSMLLFAGSALAYGNPRWFSMPVTVYIPSDASVVASAFKAWQSASEGTVRFTIRNVPNMSTRSNVTVSLVSSLPNGAAYEVSREHTILGRTDYYTKNGYFFKSHISIAKYDSDGNLIPNAKLRAIALRAVGEVLGVQPFDTANSVMSIQSDYSKTSVSGADIRALNRLYKR